VAVPGVTDKFTVTLPLDGADRLTVKEMFAPSLADPGETLTVGNGSSLVIVPVPVAVPTVGVVAPLICGLLIVTVKDSVGSYTASLQIVIGKLIEVVFAGTVNVCEDTLTKSLFGHEPPTAVPLKVE
jgi:hypothetical protein